MHIIPLNTFYYWHIFIICNDYNIILLINILTTYAFACTYFEVISFTARKSLGLIARKVAVGRMEDLDGHVLIEKHLY